MIAYFKAFINYKQSNRARFLPKAKFAYNNVKNVNIDHILFEFNYGYYLHASYKEDIDLRFWS